ncbi:hypothetical protein KC921_04460 [Candidatus Woesebacteria bacterium]|nr:hypothetical protein [Candidatus Woesebacteria bacterium]
MRKQNPEQQPASGLRAEGLVPAVGDGNPEALTTFLEKLQPTLPAGSTTKTELRPSAWMPSLFHKIMSGSAKRTGTYSQNSTETRSGLAGKVAITTMGAEFRLRNKITNRTGEKFGEEQKILITVQEMALQGIPADQLATYEAVYLLIPDVLGKLPIEIADKDKSFWANVTVVVWNDYAYQFLTQSGYKAVLIEPWMNHSIPDLVANPIIPEIRRSSDVYIKTSGSGWPKSWQKNLLSVFTKQDINFSLYLPDSKIVDANGTRDAMIPRPFYQDFNWHPPKVLIGYPSELVQVLAAHSLQADTPAFYALPPRGLHELTNLIWAMQNGFCQGMIFPEGYTNALPKHQNAPKDSLTMFHEPEIALFNDAFLAGLKPPYKLDDLLLLMGNHIPLGLALKNGSFFPKQDEEHRTAQRALQQSGLGSQSFANQLSH